MLTQPQGERKMEWQPIETAPQDEEFLGFKIGLGVVVACYLDEHHPYHDGCDFYIAWDLSPIRGLSYWMPLPAAPKEQS